jgi:capsular polysaccharide biosynthesis protein
VHGSAGANLVFARPGANVLHVFPDCVSYFVSHGIGTAAVAANYAYIFGPSFQRSIRYHNNPWVISPDRLIQAVCRLEQEISH